MDIRAGGLCSYLGLFRESVAIKVDTLDGVVSQTRRYQRMCNNVSASCVGDGRHFAQHRTQNTRRIEAGWQNNDDETVYYSIRHSLLCNNKK